MEKIIQISVATGTDGSTPDIVYALSDVGHIYKKGITVPESPWQKIQDIDFNNFK
jgi:hypothetical protein